MMIIKYAKDCRSAFAQHWKFFTVLSLCSLVLFSFINGRHRAKERISRNMRVHEQVLKDRAEARAEALRRNAEKSAPDPSVRVAPTVPRNRPTREMAEQHSGEGPSVEVMDGLEAAKAAEKQHALDTMAAAKKRREWELRRDALKKRFLANSEKIGASARATLASGDAELKLILSLFKGMSPEQLEYAREEALKTLPAEKVEAFFDDLANHGTTKTLEQLTKDAQDILKSREAQRIIDREIQVESQQIALEEEELMRTEPPIPW
jgi:hypothetical protein